jgi:hypothetical protein
MLSAPRVGALHVLFDAFDCRHDIGHDRLASRWQTGRRPSGSRDRRAAIADGERNRVVVND